MTVLDGDGVGISLIQSNFAGIGSGLSAGETGVWLQNRGAGFNLIQGHPNEFAAGKRPLHTLSPTLWTDCWRRWKLLESGVKYLRFMLARGHFCRSRPTR